MILPHTTYTTNQKLKAVIERPEKHSSQNRIEFTLDKGIDFEVTLDNNPKDNPMKVYLPKTDKLPTDILQFSSREKIAYFIERSEIEDKCMLTSDFEKAIYFYSSLDDFGEFSNFSLHGIEIDGLYYPTVEHFYQSQKFPDEVYSEKIRKAGTPKDAALMEKTSAVQVRQDWETVKTEIMTIGVRKKFETHDSVKKLLQSTKNLLLIENSPYDNYWGIGRTGTGFNQLGTVLMRVRKSLPHI